MAKQTYTATGESQVTFTLNEADWTYLQLYCTLQLPATSGQTFGMQLSFDAGVTYEQQAYVVNGTTASMLHIASSDGDLGTFYGQLYLYNAGSGAGEIASVGGPALRSTYAVFNDGSLPSLCTHPGIVTGVALQWSDGQPIHGMFALFQI